MLTFALLASALTMAAPAPMTSADAPGQAASVAVEVQVDKSGKPLSCASTVLAGDDGAGAATCSALMRKAWQPARLRNGTGVTALYREVVTWTGTASRANASLPRTDLNLKVASLPEGPKGPVDLTTVILINGAGAIEQCDGSAASEKAYANAACEVLLGQKFRERAAPNGKPMNYVTTANVRFTIEIPG